MLAQFERGEEFCLACSKVEDTWIADHQAVDSRVRQERQQLTPAASLRKALGIIRLRHRLAGPASTPIDDALEVHRVWVRLRSALLDDT